MKLRSSVTCSYTFRRNATIVRWYIVYTVMFKLIGV